MALKEPCETKQRVRQEQEGWSRIQKKRENLLHSRIHRQGAVKGNERFGSITRNTCIPRCDEKSRPVPFEALVKLLEV